MNPHTSEAADKPRLKHLITIFYQRNVLKVLIINEIVLGDTEVITWRSILSYSGMSVNAQVHCEKQKNSHISCISAHVDQSWFWQNGKELQILKRGCFTQFNITETLVNTKISVTTSVSDLMLNMVIICPLCQSYAVELWPENMMMSQSSQPLTFRI